MATSHTYPQAYKIEREFERMIEDLTDGSPESINKLLWKAYKVIGKIGIERGLESWLTMFCDGFEILPGSPDEFKKPDALVKEWCYGRGKKVTAKV